MAVRKICQQKGCRASPRWEHHRWFDVMHEGKRWRMRVDDFAFARGATEPITVKQTAEKVWQPKFLARSWLDATPTCHLACRRLRLACPSPTSSTFTTRTTSRQRDCEIR